MANSCLGGLLALSSYEHSNSTEVSVQVTVPFSPSEVHVTVLQPSELALGTKCPAACNEKTRLHAYTYITFHIIF